MKVWRSLAFRVAVLGSAALLTVLSASARAQDIMAISTEGDPWKGNPPQQVFQFSAMTGLGLIDTTPGWAWVGAAAVMLTPEGFVPDINDPVYFEGQFGPHFYAGEASWLYSAHLRWDFVRDSDWTLYALGGFGGNITGEELGDRAAFFPRFGLGAFRSITEGVKLRAELSHELTALGITFAF